MSEQIPVERHLLKCTGGHVLNALIYRPARRHGQCSTILVMTPYGAKRYESDGQRFSSAGFTMVVVDSRGCGFSSGSFEPFEHDGKDAREVITWITRQDWSNGHVGLYGGSYSGFVQWAACMESVTGLQSLAPVAAVHPGLDFPAVKGLMYLYASRWLAYVAGRTEHETQYLDNEFWARCMQRARLSSPEDWIATAGEQAATLQRWLDEVANADFWHRLVPSQSCMDKFEIPALFITGAYDDDQRGTLGYYARLSKHQRNRSLLVIGPWDHDGTRRPRARFGGLIHDPISCLDLLDLHIQWYDYTLNRKERPAIFQAPILYYMAGRECWFECESLEALSDPHLTLHCTNSNELIGEPDARKTLSWVSSGLAPCIGNVMENEPIYRGRADLLDQVGGIAFTTEILHQSLALCGAPTVTLHLQAAQDTDVCVSLYGLLPDRTAVYLGSANRRVSGDPELQVQPWHFDSFNLIFRELPPLSQLRMRISLSDPSIWLSDNNARTTLKVLCGGDCPCILSLPLQNSQARCK